MPASTLRPALIALALGAALGSHAADFRYDGRLDDFGRPANGRYDIELSLFGDETGAKALSSALTFPGVEVRDGRFQLDFDVPLTNAKDAWVQIGVRASGDANFSAIPGRSKAVAAGPIGACWSSTGDSGSSPSTNFLGTTDAQPLVIKTGNAQSLRIEPSIILFGGNPITANVIAGSSANNVTAGVRGATIAGGGVPLGDVDPQFAVGAPNRVTDHYGTVSGGYANQAGDASGTTVDGAFGTVGGGMVNEARGQYSTVGGGASNSAVGLYATVAGGAGNNAFGEDSTVSGGAINVADGNGATVSGGQDNHARAWFATVGGGQVNTASQENAIVAGGVANTASGLDSMVLGGGNNCAGGAYSFASGNNAKVRPGSNSGAVGQACDGIPLNGNEGDEGTFIWADRQSANFISTGPNQFLVRAAGGFMLNTTTQIAGYDDVVLRSSATTADPDMDLRLITRSGKDALIYLADGTGSLVFRPNGIGATYDRLQVEGGMGGTAALSNGGTWTNASSRTFKEDFQPVDAQYVLARVLDLDISRWQYIGSGEGEHMGPVAEDFHAAFGLGRSEKQIATVDADGVALAAIQGLNAKLEAENAAKDARIEALRDELAALRALIEARLPAEH